MTIDKNRGARRTSIYFNHKNAYWDNEKEKYIWEEEISGGRIYLNIYSVDEHIDAQNVQQKVDDRKWIVGSSSHGDKAHNGYLCRDCGDMFIHTGNHKCINCLSGASNNPRVFARVNDKRWYTPDTICSECGTAAVRRVQDNVCSHCAGINPGMPGAPKTGRARPLARAENKRWYEPEEPCDKCKTSAVRRVVDNVCSRCAGITPGGKPGVRPSSATSNRQRSLQKGYKFFIAENTCNTCQCITIRRTANSQCMFCVSNSNKLAFEGSAAIIAALPVSNSLVEGDAENGYQIKA